MKVSFKGMSQNGPCQKCGTSCWPQSRPCKSGRGGAVEFDPSHSSLPSDTQRPQGPRSTHSIPQLVPHFQSWCRWTEWSRKASGPRVERKTGREVSAGPTWLTLACPSAGLSRWEAGLTIDPKAKEETGFQGRGCEVNTATGPGGGEVMGERNRVCGVFGNKRERAELVLKKIFTLCHLSKPNRSLVFLHLKICICVLHVQVSACLGMCVCVQALPVHPPIPEGTRVLPMCCL